MSKEGFIHKVPIESGILSDDDRTQLLAELRSHPTGIDNDRAKAEWNPRSYFHSIQDLRMSLYDKRYDPKDIRHDQACFTRDLDWYRAGLPHDEIITPWAYGDSLSGQYMLKSLYGK